ncbi:MAG: hypothetical protein GY946_32985 [bacterium]|nr:hypothetical protein [bacterium]
MKDIKLAIYEWPEEVDAATRAAAPEKLVSLIDGGRDGIEAEEWFINQGNKVAGFLISQFKKIDDEKGFQDRMAMTEVMVLDRTLCKMDGYLARKWNSTDMITHVSTEKYARARLKRWNAWWMRGYWKQHTKPWDPRVDEVDPDAPKPEDVEGRGFGGEKDK